jgi:hypothetical protein
MTDEVKETICSAKCIDLVQQYRVHNQRIIDEVREERIKNKIDQTEYTIKIRSLQSDVVKLDEKNQVWQLVSMSFWKN